jgi:carbon storage regulator
MLVLSRKLNERIIIGDAIEVSVLSISRDKIKLGIHAPRVISVHRKEVYDLIHKENALASRMDNNSIETAIDVINNAKVSL